MTNLAGPEDFNGVARLFPLPNFVMLPHVVKPFHIFEPRYRELTEHALASDQLMTLVLPLPGWESDYDGAFPLHDMACLTQIIRHERLPDGRFNLLLRGICRLKLERELLTQTRYRQAQARPLPDPPHPDLPALRRSLLASAESWLSPGPALGQFHTLFGSGMALGTLVDVVAFAFPLPSEVKQRLLESLDVAQRTELLIAALKEHKPATELEGLLMPRERRPPPDFSVN